MPPNTRSEEEMRWLLSFLLFVLCFSAAGILALHWQPLVETQPVESDADDPAIWIHPSTPEKSLIIGTDKTGNALFVFDLQGNIVQRISDIQRPNNVDVEYGFKLKGRQVDIVVATERYAHRLRIFAVDAHKRCLYEIGDSEGTRVFEGEQGEKAEPMGIALYRRPRDGAIFAIVSRKNGPQEGYLWQYLLVSSASGRVRLQKVREFGRFCGKGEIEAIAVDDSLGYVYCADEQFGVRKYFADPDHPNANQELAVFATEGFEGDREGIAIYPLDYRRGYILCTDQRPDHSVVYLYPREGSVSHPHNHRKALAVISSCSDETDGIEVAACSMGAKFPHGLLVMMHSKGRNFHLYRWEPMER